MADARDVWRNMRDLFTQTARPAARRGPLPELRPKPGRAPSDPAPSTLPIPLTQLVQVSRVDIEGELQRAIEGGNSRVTIGIGRTSDIQLLDDDLLAADVALRDRELEIVTVIFSTRRGYSIARGQGNFGVFVDGDPDSEYFGQLHRYRQMDDLRPGDRVGLGSCPGDALWFRLPSIRGVRLEARPTREASPASGYQLRYQAQIRAALLYWRYPSITFGSDEDVVVQMKDPELIGLRGAILRNPDDPTSGHRLLIQRPGPGVSWCKGGHDRFEGARVGKEVVLHGFGNRIRFGSEHQVELPAPSVVVGRFTGREHPNSEDIVAVLGLHPDNLQEPELVKKRYRQLARELHPDRVGDNEGHVSRFLEVQACWEAYQRSSPADQRSR